MNTGANLEKGPFWRKQKNVAKCGAKLGGSLETRSDGDDSRMPALLTELNDTPLLLNRI